MFPKQMRCAIAMVSISREIKRNPEKRNKKAVYRLSPDQAYKI